MAQSGILAAVSRRRSEVPGAFRIVEAKICMPKKQKTGYSRKKTAAKIPVTREKYASFFPEEQVWTQSAGKVQTGFRYRKEQP